MSRQIFFWAKLVEVVSPLLHRDRPLLKEQRTIASLLHLSSLSVRKLRFQHVRRNTKPLSRRVSKHCTESMRRVDTLKPHAA